MYCSDMSIALSVRNLTKTYKLYKEPRDRLKEAFHPLKKSYHKNFNAIDDVNFEINCGETVGIIGANGSGKSTLLKLITHVLTPTSGSAIVHGRVAAILELGGGFNPELTGLENIYLINTINGIPEAETKKRAQEITEFADLGENIHQHVKNYSSGMNARLAFAIAINVEPDVLIVDEALSVGDAAFQRKCFAKMEHIRKAGTTILFVSHSEAHIVSLCTRAIWLANGSKILDGEPKIVTNLYLKNMTTKIINRAEILDEYDALIKAQRDVGSKQHNSECTTKDPASRDSRALIEGEYYNQALRPASRIEYPVNGAKIYNLSLKGRQGLEVNYIAVNNYYFLSYDVVFLKSLSEADYNEIKMSILINDAKGILLSGVGVPISKYNICDIKEGQSFRLRWKFKNRLNAGDYFISCAVNLWKQDKEVLHNIKDALQIKVLDRIDNFSHGYVDLDFDLQISREL